MSETMHNLPNLTPTSIQVVIEYRGEIYPVDKPRFLIGSGEFADIRLLEASGGGIVASVKLEDDYCVLKALAKDQKIILSNEVLHFGQETNVYKSAKIAIGKDKFHILITDVLSREKLAAQIQKSDGKASEEQIIATISDQLIEKLNIRNLSMTELESGDLQERALFVIRELLADLDQQLLSRKDFEKKILDEVFGLGAINDLINDDSISEIMVNAADTIFIERAGKLVRSGKTYSSEKSLMNSIEKIVSSVGRRIDLTSPLVDARLLDGSRVNAIIPPLALNGPTLTIRKFGKVKFGLKDLQGMGCLTEAMRIFIEQAVIHRKNIIISGGTGSGKTTLLNALAQNIPHDERIITIEDSAEIQLIRDHWVRLESRPSNLEGRGAITIRDLLKNTLRMRPDRIIVGECRSGEALDMLQAMNTGHDGSMTTAHANSSNDLLKRIETMVLLSGIEIPLIAIRDQIGSAIDIIIQQSRLGNGKRLITEICAIQSYDRKNDRYDIEPLFSFDRKTASHKQLAEVPTYES